MKSLDKLPVATILTAILVAIAAGVGGAVVLFGDGLTFQEYLEQLRYFAGAVGLLAIGRGILKSKPSSEATATVNVPKQPATPGPVSTTPTVAKLTAAHEREKRATKKKPPRG